MYFISFSSITIQYFSVKEFDEGLVLAADDFLRKYGFTKPSSDTLIITHCNKGGRAQNAADALVEKGFTNVKWETVHLTLSLLTASGVPFWEIFNFHLEGKGCPDTYERRDYEALAG